MCKAHIARQGVEGIGMSLQEWIRAIDRLRELERNRALPEVTLRDLDNFYLQTIFDEDNGLLSEADRRAVQDHYIATL